MQHTSFGEGAYLQIPLGYGFFLHAELQVLHFPGEGEREWSVTLRLASHLQAATAHGPPLHNKKLRKKCNLLHRNSSAEAKHQYTRSKTVKQAYA